MPNVIEITDFAAPELDVYARLTQAQLRSRLEPEKGIFIAESPKVIARALDAGYQPISFLMERKQITGPASEVLARCGNAPVYTADRAMLAQLTGFELTRGVLCAMHRPLLPHGGGSLPQCPPGGRAGRHCGFHQRRGHLPQCCRPEHGCRARHTLLLRSAVPPGRAGQHGHRVPGALDPDRLHRRRLAGAGHAAAARPRLQDRRHGADRPFGYLSTMPPWPPSQSWPSCWAPRAMALPTPPLPPAITRCASPCPTGSILSTLPPPAPLRSGSWANSNIPLEVPHEQNRTCYPWYISSIRMMASGMRF